jgi:hypothetical protein
MASRNRSVIAAFLLTSATFLGACTESNEEPLARTAQSTEEALQELKAEKAAKAKAPNLTTDGGSNDADATVMDRPLDGSSKDAFEKGLATVRSSAPAGQSQRLDSALKYLLTYDFSLQNDKARLYAKLDGKSPNEIIAQSRQR